MKIISEEELATKLDFMRPIHPAPDETESLWCIPFEFGMNPKGTRISISKAKEISAELRASVAEAELRQLRKYFDVEKKRADDFAGQASKAEGEKAAAQGECMMLRTELRKRPKRKKPTRSPREEPK